MTEENVIQFAKPYGRVKKTGLFQHSIESKVPHLLVSTKSSQVLMELMRQQIQKSRQEIAGLRDHQERVIKEALTEPLTSLANINGLSKDFDAALFFKEGFKVSPYLLKIYIDHLKKLMICMVNC